jgi:coenzyme PQQ precursor peptide PqqA
MAWKTPKIVEVPVGMEINMYACAARRWTSGRNALPKGGVCEPVSTFVTLGYRFPEVETLPLEFQFSKK